MLRIPADAQIADADVAIAIGLNIFRKSERCFQKRFDSNDKSFFTDLLRRLDCKDANIGSDIHKHLSPAEKVLEVAKLWFQRVPKDIHSASSVSGAVISLDDCAILQACS